MPSSQVNIAEQIPISTLKRRLAGGKEWRVKIEEILAAKRLQLAQLKALRKQRAEDPATLQLIMDIYELMMEEVIALNELYHYRDKGDELINGQQPVPVGAITNGAPQ